MIELRELLGGCVLERGRVDRKWEGEYQLLFDAWSLADTFFGPGCEVDFIADQPGDALLLWVGIPFWRWPKLWLLGRKRVRAAFEALRPEGCAVGFVFGFRGELGSSVTRI